MAPDTTELPGIHLTSEDVQTPTRYVHYRWRGYYDFGFLQGWIECDANDPYAGAVPIGLIFMEMGTDVGTSLRITAYQDFQNRSGIDYDIGYERTGESTWVAHPIATSHLSFTTPNDTYTT